MSMILNLIQTFLMWATVGFAAIFIGILIGTTWIALQDLWKTYNDKDKNNIDKPKQV